MQAILADTEFLAQNSIMDYSLLTCIHEDTGELVVGIIGTTLAISDLLVLRSCTQSGC